MFSFNSDTIYNAWKNLNLLDAKIGGMFCILSCIDEEIVPNISYKIDGVKLRQKLSYVFDKEYKFNFSTQQANYIIFAKNWFVTFFANEIKNKIDLLSCAVFFLRRHNFEKIMTSQEIINIFLHSYHLSNYKDIWFSSNSTLNIHYASNESENNQKVFYSLLSKNSFLSITFNGTLQKNAYDLSAAGHIQTLYSAKGILKTCIFSNEPLDSYYIMKNTKHNSNVNSNLSFIDYNFSQIIYYGVPGSGKSHKIDEATKDLPDEQKMRVVFHPEYTNADFVGQILPSNTSGTISYQFKPGPFTKILRRAYLNPSKKYYLIIEEINRGNAAAIFGDVFQLLDRITDGKGETNSGYSYGNGWSRYSIENEFINWYIRENLYADINHKLQNEDDGIAKKSVDESQKAIEIGELHFSALTGIRLPPNLSLYATMNTSDQNVFTLDNAFQRRWDMQLVPNECNDTNQLNATITVNNQSITWKNFQQTINAVIGEKSNEGGLSSMEDKRLGCWFVKAENGKINANVFADKVLKYLWDDAFKFYHQEMFKGGIKNFEELHRRFLAEGFSVFNDVCRLGEKLQSVESSAESSSTSIDSESSSE